ncbi:MAG: hypothetical protein HOO93_14445 [Methyloglobulus sp.]|nr:hypothetical protein [Methyloglobulus sp.]
MDELTREYEGRISATDVAFADIWTHDDALNIIRLYRCFIRLGLMPPDNLLLASDGYFGAYLEANGDKSLDEAFGLVNIQRIGHPITYRKGVKAIKNAACFIMWHDKETARLQGKQPLTNTKAVENVINEFSLTLDADNLASYYQKNKFGQASDALCAEYGADSEFMRDMLKVATQTLQAIDK